MSPCSCFHYLIWKFSAFHQISGDNLRLLCAKIVVIVIQLLNFNFDYYKYRSGDDTRIILAVTHFDICGRMIIKATAFLGVTIICSVQVGC